MSFEKPEQNFNSANWQFLYLLLGSRMSVEFSGIWDPETEEFRVIFLKKCFKFNFFSYPMYISSFSLSIATFLNPVILFYKDGLVKLRRSLKQNEIRSYRRRYMINFSNRKQMEYYITIIIF